MPRVKILKDEWYPVYDLVENQNSLDSYDIEIDLTDEEKSQFIKVISEFNKWQEIVSLKYDQAWDKKYYPESDENDEKRNAEREKLLEQARIETNLEYENAEKNPPNIGLEFISAEKNGVFYKYIGDNKWVPHPKKIK